MTRRKFRWTRVTGGHRAQQALQQIGEVAVDPGNSCDAEDSVEARGGWPAMPCEELFLKHREAFA